MTKDELINLPSNMALIPKVGKKPDTPANFRRISFLEITGKIFEIIINIRLSDNLDERDLYNKDQHAVSFSLALTEKKQCTVVLRKVYKTFDKVWHTGKKFKIPNLDLPPKSSKFLCNFLDDRHGRITIG